LIFIQGTFVLFGEKTSDRMLRKRPFRVKVLNEADHGFVTNGVELILGACLYVRYKLPVVYLSMNRVRSNVLFDFVLKICQKSQIVFKLDHEGLVVHRLPRTLNGGVVALRKVSILTEGGLRSKIWSNHYLPNVLVFKGPSMTLS